MKVVIDITEEDYLNLIKTDENGEKEIPLGLLMSLWDCVKYKCTPLPKGHGRLIDADAYVKEYGCYGYLLDIDIDYFNKVIPTIIEADK